MRSARDPRPVLGMALVLLVALFFASGVTRAFVRCCGAHANGAEAIELAHAPGHCAGHGAAACAHEHADDDAGDVAEHGCACEHGSCVDLPVISELGTKRDRSPAPSFPAADLPIVSTVVAPPREAPRHGRRVPERPRIDARTALRRCVLLLI